MNLEVIGGRLRTARAARKMSLREMARRIEVSPSFVSQVELGRAKPSVGTLYAMVSELGLSLDELMASDEAIVPVHGTTDSEPPEHQGVSSTAGATPTPSSSDIRHFQTDRLNHPFTSLPRDSAVFDPFFGAASPVQRAQDRQKLQISGATWERLTSSDDPFVDFLHVHYATGGESCPADHFIHHGGREYGHIITGRLRVQIAFEEYELGPGDSITFDSMTPHRLSNPFEDESLSIWVVVGRRGTTQL